MREILSVIRRVGGNVLAEWKADGLTEEATERVAHWASISRRGSVGKLTVSASDRVPADSNPAKETVRLLGEVREKK
jgi:hypothetical protein